MSNHPKSLIWLRYISIVILVIVCSSILYFLPFLFFGFVGTEGVSGSILLAIFGILPWSLLPLVGEALGASVVATYLLIRSDKHLQPSGVALAITLFISAIINGESWWWDIASDPNNVSAMKTYTFIALFSWLIGGIIYLPVVAKNIKKTKSQNDLKY